MALFGIKKNKEEKESKAKKSAKTEAVDTVVEKALDLNKESKKQTKKVSKKYMYRKNPKKRAKDFAKRPRAKSPNPTRDLSEIIIQPRITEKGAILASEKNVYVFNVALNATKPEIKEAIHQIYKVTPANVTITRVPDKKVRVRGQRRKTGVKSGGKKAYVYLKKGDKIDFV